MTGFEPATTYLKGLFLITSLDVNAPADDDLTYSVTFENVGAPEVLDGTKLLVASA